MVVAVSQAIVDVIQTLRGSIIAGVDFGALRLAAQGDLNVKRRLFFSTKMRSARIFTARKPCRTEFTLVFTNPLLFELWLFSATASGSPAPAAAATELVAQVAIRKAMLIISIRLIVSSMWVYIFIGLWAKSISLVTACFIPWAAATGKAYVDRLTAG